MKIKIKSLKQELKKPNDELKTQIIHAFIRAEPGTDHSQLKNTLSKLGIEPCQAISYLSKEEVASNLYTKAVELHNSFCENEVKVDAFGNFPKIGHDPNQVPGSNKNTEPGRNFMQEKKMKISKEYLKQVIQEEIAELLETSKEDEEWDEDTEDFQKWPKGKDIEPDEDDKDKEED